MTILDVVGNKRYLVLYLRTSHRRIQDTDIWVVAWDFQQCSILTCVDSDEPVQPPFKLRNSKWCSVSSLTVIEYSSDKQRLWSDCASAQADLRICWSHIPHCWKSHALAHILYIKRAPVCRIRPWPRLIMTLAWWDVLTQTQQQHQKDLHIYLRNLLTHTVNNSLQKLNYVKHFQYSVVNKNSILFTSFVKISEQYLGYYAKYSLFNLKGPKSKVTKYRI